MFDTFILFVIAYSCFTTVYYVSFNQNPNQTLYAVDIVVNVAFFLDFIFNFLTEYKDKETLDWVRDPYKIAIEYAKGFMLLDFVATFPFDIFSDGGNVMWTRLIRLARLSKLASILDIGRITRIVKKIFKNSQSKDRVQNQYIIMYTYKILRLVIIAFLITYFCGCIWWIICGGINTQYDIGMRNTYATYHDLDKLFVHQGNMGLCGIAECRDLVQYEKNFPFKNN